MSPKTSKRAVTISSVEAHGVSYRYGERYALYKVDVALEPGAPCVILGPNGSGKTTLIEVLSMALRPERGQLVFYDERRQVVEPRRRRPLTTVLGHEPLCHGELTPRENVSLFLRLWGTKGASPKSPMVTEALKNLGLDPWDPRPVSELSQGTRRRVDLAVVLSLDTPVLLLDEPFAALDPKSRQNLAERLRRKSRRHIVALSTHDETLLELLDTDEKRDIREVLAVEIQALRLDAGQVVPASLNPEPQSSSKNGGA